jgi:hypothetical protein
MVRMLKNLRIDEVAIVVRGANPGAKVMIRKSDGPLMFNDIVAKADVSDPLRGPREEPGDHKLSDQLNELVTEMVAAAPSLHPQRARRWLLHTEPGRALLAQHTTKKEQPMNRSEEMQEMQKFIKSGGMSAVAKRIVETGSTSLTEQEYTELVQGDAALRKVSFEQAFTDPTTQQGYKIVREAGYLKSMASLTPTSVVVGSSETEDDSAEATRQLMEMARKQGRKFEDVFKDPINARLAARTYPYRVADWHSAATPK